MGPIPDQYQGKGWPLLEEIGFSQTGLLWDTRDQGWCGSSWAVAPAAAMSARCHLGFGDRLCRMSIRKNLPLKISRQAILSCGATDAWECGGGKDGLPGWQQEIMRNFHGQRVSCEEPSEWGCQGGDVDRAWSYMEGHG